MRGTMPSTSPSAAAIARADALVDWLQHAWAHPTPGEVEPPIGARLTQLIRRASLLSRRRSCIGATRRW